MDDELVLLTSYFNLAGGRRQDTADTFRVEPSLPSATSQAGSAALYIVTESSGGGHMGQRARRIAADVVVWEYSSHAEDPPATRLKAALRAAHETVFGEFDGHVAVGLSVMAVERDTVYLGQVAPAQVYVLHEGSLHSISANVEGTSLYGRALGSSAGPRISVFRDEIGPHDVVTLCSSWFHQGADPDDLRDRFGAETEAEIAEGLLELAKQHDVRDATGIVVEAVSATELEAGPAEDEPPGFMDQIDAAVQALAEVGRMLWSEFRGQPYLNGRDGTAASAQIAELLPSGPPGDASAGPRERDEAPARTSVTQRVPDAARLDQPFEAPQATRGTAPEAAPAHPTPEQATDEVPIIPSVDRAESLEREIKSKAEREPVSELEQVNSRIQRAPDLGDVIPPVQAFPDTSTEPERIYATSRDMRAVNKRPRRFGGIAGPGRRDAASGPAVIRPPLSTIDLSRPSGRPAPPAVIWFGIAAVFVLAAFSLYTFLHHRHTPPVNPYPALVRKDIALASRAKTVVQQESYLGKARTNIALARQNGAQAATIRTLRRELQTTADSLHHITRVTAPVLLSDFGQFPGATPEEIATAPGTVFVLDAKRGVFAVTPNASSNPSLVTQHGDQVSGFTFADPAHIATDGSTALALDSGNILVRDASGVKTATSLPGGAVHPEHIVSMATNDPDVYVLDTANSQVWRYPGAVSFYSTTPSAFFSPTTPALGQAVSMALDGTYMYILKADGSVLKFDIQFANPQKFTLDLRTLPSNPVALVTGHGLNWVWIADPVHRRILQLDKSGGYDRTYLSGVSTLPFDQIKSLAVGPAGKTMYVLAGSKLFEFPVRP